MLSKAQLTHYHEQGYLVIDKLIGSSELASIKSRAKLLVSQWQDDSSENVFSTKDNNRSGDDYFLDSAEQIRCFFEEDAFDSNGQLVQDKSLCINKIGHALHQLDPVFEQFSHQSVLAIIANDLGIKEPQIRQSMYIFKQPNIGGEVNWHQDATFFFTTPQSVVTFWFAIEDATLQNGCLWLEPAGHKGPLREQFILKGRDTMMKPLDDTPWPNSDSGQPVEVKAGTLIIFQGYLPHYSAPNRSTKSRQAYTLHVTDGTANYDSQNWLQATVLPLRGFDG
jgi:phytanoyl-CoA hydroxylase